MTMHLVEERMSLEAQTGVEYHIDHIIPVVKGGTHTPDNLRVITAAENLSKYDWFLDEYENLNDEDIERLDQEALSFSASVKKERSNDPTATNH